MGEHAKLSASGAKRWMNCPPSAEIESKLPDQQTTFAAEGTLAHRLAEMQIRIYLGGNDGADIAEFEECCKAEGVTQEMLDYVQIYVDFVIEQINVARAVSPDAVILLEDRLDFSHIVPGGFGTGDVVIIADGLCKVIDLKYGKGVPVSAVENPQMRLYGLGAINLYDFLYDIQRVRMTIMQPRLSPEPDSEELTAAELIAWGETEVKPKALLAAEGKGEFKSGDWCRFCKIRHTCRTRAEENLQLEKFDLQKPPTLTIPEIAEILGRADQLIAWAGDVKGWALEQAEKHGVTFPGWKLVEGRSNRAYTDKLQVENALIIAGYLSEAIHKEPELLGITEMEKLIGKTKFGELLGELVIKPPGKPTLAPEADKRPAINSVASAQADFADMPAPDQKPEKDFSNLGATPLEQYRTVKKRIGG